MNSANTPKWIPKHSSDIHRMFTRCKELEFQLRFLTRKYSTDINLDLIDCYGFQQLMEESKKCLLDSEDIQVNLRTQLVTAASKKVSRSPYKSILQKKAILMSENLRKRHYQLIFIINKTIKSLLDICNYSDVILDSGLLLCDLFNESVQLTTNGKSSHNAKICSNTFPSLLLQLKKINIAAILQIICKNRSEQCCLTLISSLLGASNKLIELAPGGENESESSSLEISRTLTSHLNATCIEGNAHNAFSTTSRPDESKMSRSKDRRSSAEPESIALATSTQSGPHLSPPRAEINSIHQNEMELKNSFLTSFHDAFEEIVIHEEILESLVMEGRNFLVSIIGKCMKYCPNAFDTAISNEEDVEKLINRGTRSLWTQIGGTLDHVLLWWSEFFLACRPVMGTKQLRDWLLQIRVQDASEPIFSTLRGLGETLTTYVTNTLWDQQFRLALVVTSFTSEKQINFSSILKEKEGERQNIGTSSGNFWHDLLHSLVRLCNTCDQNGTIPNQLPIVEQIPVLHRLDHSVHSMRLWAMGKAKALCSEWNMDMFFKMLNGDIRNCLNSLRLLRVPELVSANSLEVLIQVCVALRSKLVSEVRENVSKLEKSNVECIEILSSTCRTYTLATLSLCFPMAKEWQTESLNMEAGEYVTYFLEQIYQPILQATRDIEILGLVLKIICEAWLDHIYQKRVKFTRYGAVNLLKDFDGVSEWIIKSPDVSPDHVERLSKHEVLRMCEGVGKILLRKPDEVVPIITAPRYSRKHEDEDTEEEQEKLPPEMFVPNQQRWLELRARNRKNIYFICVCNGIETRN